MKKAHQLSATEAVKKIQANQLSSEELLRSCIERIEEKESSTQAWVETNFKAALDRARYLDRSANKGLLHGLPFGAKANGNVSGRPSSARGLSTNSKPGARAPINKKK